MCIACNNDKLSQIKAMTNQLNLLTNIHTITESTNTKSAQLKNLSSELADFIFHGGTITTMDELNTQVEAVAISNGKIIAMGQFAELIKLKQATTQVIDLQGASLLPGFIEPHLHPLFVVQANWVNLSPFENSDLSAVEQKIMTAIAKAKSGEWIACCNFDPLITPGEFSPSYQKLTEMAPNNPLLIWHDSAHVAYANKMAFAMVGITPTTPNPQFGGYERDAAGNFTGLILEQLAIANFISKIPLISADQFVAALKNLFQEISAAGCTSIHDAACGVLNPAMEHSLIKSVVEGGCPIRYSGFLIMAAKEKFAELGINQPSNESNLFRLNGLKIVLDGSTQIGTALYREPYLDKQYGCGKANYTQEELNNLVIQANHEGWQIGIHANGDAAIDMAITAFEAAYQQNPRSELRHRIEHCSICHPEQFARMAKIGISPSFLIAHVHYWSAQMRDNLIGEQRTNLMDSAKTALDNKLRISFHSDWSVSPIRPLEYIHNAVNRIVRDTGEVLNAAERISPLQALKAMTIDAAWQCQLDDIVGSIEIGKYADFVILDQDILSIPPQNISAVNVLQTWKEGICHYKK